MKRSIWAAAALVALAVASCSTGTDGSTTTLGSPTTSPGEPGVTSTTTPDTETTLRDSTTTSTTVTAYEIVLEPGDDGELQVIGPDEIQVHLGDTVQITFHSSVDGEVHIHGYDLFFDLGAGGRVAIEFLADVPGIFEAELEGEHLLLFELEVTP